MGEKQGREILFPLCPIFSCERPTESKTYAIQFNYIISIYYKNLPGVLPCKLQGRTPKGMQKAIPETFIFTYAFLLILQ